MAAGAIAIGACAGKHPREAVDPGTQPSSSSSPSAQATNQPASQPVAAAAAEPIIDIHQHTTYHKRSNEGLIHHQRKMGVTHTILLPGGSPVITESTLKGKANGLYAGAGTTDTCIAIAKQFPGEYFFGANEVPDLPEARQRIQSYLKQGAVCIGEQKFNLPVDSPDMVIIYQLAQDFGSVGSEMYPGTISSAG